MSVAEIAGSAAEVAEPATTEALQRRVAKLERINAALMTHVERMTDQHEGAYSLFQTAIMLEGRVRSRTEELTGLMHRLERSNLALEAAKNEAEQANRSKTRFLAAASHDLLQPLNAARLSISTLADVPLEPAAAAIVRRVERGLETIEELIKTLLDISKLDAGVVQPHCGAVDLHDLLAEVEAAFRIPAEAKGLRLRVRCAPALSAFTDAGLLKRVLGNLVSNAVRYTEHGGVVLAARPRGGCCRIEVVDTGRGIPPSERELIFEEFFRGRSAQSAEGGLGLGLSIVRRMLATLGHDLSFRSRPGCGSWFSLDLPACGQPSRRAAPEPSAPHPVGLRALVVENDAPTLDAMVRLLGSWGMVVRALEDARAFLVEPPGPADAAGFDLVLADYHLGDGVVGPAVVAAARLRSGRDIPAILVTADHTEEVRAHAHAAGCSLVHKPVKPAQLRSLVSYLVARDPAGDPAS